MRIGWARCPAPGPRPPRHPRTPRRMTRGIFLSVLVSLRGRRAGVKTGSYRAKSVCFRSGTSPHRALGREGLHASSRSLDERRIDEVEGQGRGPAPPTWIGDFSPLVAADHQTLMWSVAEIGSGVAWIEVPN